VDLREVATIRISGNDARGCEIFDVFGEFMRLGRTDAREGFGIEVKNHRCLDDRRRIPPAGQRLDFGAQPHGRIKPALW